MRDNNKKLNIFLPAILIAVVATALMAGVYIGQRRAINYYRTHPTTLQANDKMSAILSLINGYYVDSIQLDSLSEDLIPKLLAKLDPHSVYISSKEFAAANEPLDGEFDGIGVLFNMMTDTIAVINVIPGGPSEKAGVLAGDRIMSVDGKIVAGRKISQDSVVKMLRGKRGSKVSLGIMRASNQKLIPITVVRGAIPFKSIDTYYRFDDGTAYIKLARFSRNTYTEFMEAVSTLSEKSKIEKLIFDLRDNTGGYLDQAILIANEFLDKNKMIVYTQGAHSERREQLSDGKGRLKEVEVAILINEGSASASEIVSGALQDNDRGTIIGRRSFGKGLVQEQIPFRDGSAIRLTIARYYTPLGRSIQKPYNKGIDNYNMDIYNRYAHDELLNVDSIKINDTTRYITPKGKVLYGGGGIMPDIFVPIDTVSGIFMREILRNGLVPRFALVYADRHRIDLNAIKNTDDMERYFRKHENRIYDEFMAYVVNEKVRTTPLSQQNQKELRCELKAFIGRNTPLDDNGYYHYIREIDQTLQRAVSYIR